MITSSRSSGHLLSHQQQHHRIPLHPSRRTSTRVSLFAFSTPTDSNASFRSQSPPSDGASSASLPFLVAFTSCAARSSRQPSSTAHGSLTTPSIHLLRDTRLLTAQNRSHTSALHINITNQPSSSSQQRALRLTTPTSHSGLTPTTHNHTSIPTQPPLTCLENSTSLSMRS